MRLKSKSISSSSLFRNWHLSFETHWLMTRIKRQMITPIKVKTLDNKMQFSLIHQPIRKAFKEHLLIKDQRLENDLRNRVDPRLSDLTPDWNLSNSQEQTLGRIEGSLSRQDQMGAEHPSFHLETRIRIANKRPMKRRRRVHQGISHLKPPRLQRMESTTW